MSEPVIAITENENVRHPPRDLEFSPDDSVCVISNARRIIELLKWICSFPAMLGALLVGRVFIEARTFHVDPDLWWHIKTGQSILATHHWPTTDPYSFTVAGTPWLAYEWLGDVCLGAVEKYGGLQGLVTLLIVLSSMTMILLYYLAATRSGNSKAAFVVSLFLCSLAFASFNLRPQMFGYLFLVLTLIALEHFRRGRELAIWFLPLLFLLWINTHGSWVIGLGVILTYLICGLKRFNRGSIEATAWTTRQRRALEMVVLLCLVVIPITPYGSKLAAYPFTVASSLPVNVGNVSEWQPMPFNLIGGKLFLVALLGFLMLQMGVRRKFYLAEILLFFAGTALACMHVRFLILFVPFFAPLVTTLLAPWLPPYERDSDRFALNAALMLLVAGAIGWGYPSNRTLAQIVDRTYPVKAVQYLNQHSVAGPMYNTYGYGGYLVFSRWPEHKIFIDGRGDLYEENGVFSDYLEVSGLKPAAFNVLKTYGIQSCLINRDEPLAVALAALPSWQRVYSDDLSVLYVRRDVSVQTVARVD